MIYSYEMMHKDFILFGADQMTSQALGVVQQLQPTSVIVRRWYKNSVYYYLYTRQNFLERLSRKHSEEILLQALALHERQATAYIDAYDDAEDIPLQCIVTDGARIVGVYDASLPPVLHSKDIRCEEEPTEMVESAPVSRSVQADFPEQVLLGQTASLLVNLTLDNSSRSAVPVATPIGAEVTVIVRPQRGFTLEGSEEGKLMVTNEEETLPIRFVLRATGLGPGRIRVSCFQGAQPLGETMLASTVVAAEQQVDQYRNTSLQKLAPFAMSQPDLTLLVLEHDYQGNPAITLRLSALDPTLELNLKPFGPILLRAAPLQYFHDFFKDIEGLPLKTAEDQTVAETKMALKGSRLFQDLLPDDLRVLLWSLRNRIQTVQILSEEPWIPWELLKLQGQEHDRVVEGPFLCEAFAMTRWFPGIGRRPELHLEKMAVVVPSDSGLPTNSLERNYLLSLANSSRQVVKVPATFLAVVNALSQGKYDGWHFTGHGKFEVADPNRSPIFLERNQQLCAAEICGQVSNCGLTHPLVFLNACQTGRESLSLTGIGGWARSFIDAGAAGFVGSLWSVYDDAAYQFAQAFYTHLLNGKTIGQAVKEARAVIRPLKDPTWLAYTVFADPFATV